MRAALIAASGLIVCCSIFHSAQAQMSDPSAGFRLAAEYCATCHQIAPDASAQRPENKAPSFVDVGRMASTTELSIKVFLRSSHPTMPNVMLTPEETDAIAAYIVSLAKK